MLIEIILFFENSFWTVQIHETKLKRFLTTGRHFAKVNCYLKFLFLLYISILCPYKITDIWTFELDFQKSSPYKSFAIHFRWLYCDSYIELYLLLASFERKENPQKVESFVLTHTFSVFLLIRSILQKRKSSKPISWIDKWFNFE